MGRNRSRRTRGQTTTARRSKARSQPREVLRLPGLREMYDAVLAGCAELAVAADALDAELWLAYNVCAVRASAPDAEAFGMAMLDLIDELERDGRRDCLVLLRTIAAAGPPELAEPAARAAQRLTNRAAPGLDGMVGLPGWVDQLGEATLVGDCCVWTDAYGEYTQVYGEFVHADGGRRHGVLFTIDLAFHGVLYSVDVVTKEKDLDRVARDMQRDVRRDGGRFERVPPASVGELLRTALDTFADPALPSLHTAPSPNRSRHLSHGCLALSRPGPGQPRPRWLDQPPCR